jgi:1-acyl-sn-glycerol-3-phosphate acyltransferase
MGAMIKTIFSFAHVIISMIICTPFGIVALFFGLCGLRRLKRAAMYLISLIWSRLIIIVIGCKVTVTGKENVPRTGGVCFVCNHGSFFDIPLLMAFSWRVLGFVAKKELLFVPFLSLWIAMLDGLFIDRKNPRKGLNTINKGIARIKAGSCMLIFPEGHRSRGEGLLPFHPGSLKLATQSEAVIVPVAIKGSYDVFEKNNRVKAVPVHITFCKSINTADIPKTDRKLILSDQIYGVIKEALNG